MCIRRRKRIHIEFVGSRPSLSLGLIPNDNVYIWEDCIHIFRHILHNERRGEVHSENLSIFRCFSGQQKGRFQAMGEKEAPKIKVRGVMYIGGYLGCREM
jgi:hypothetical protein